MVEVKEVLPLVSEFKTLFKDQKFKPIKSYIDNINSNPIYSSLQELGKKEYDLFVVQELLLSKAKVFFHSGDFDDSIYCISTACDYCSQAMTKHKWSDRSPLEVKLDVFYSYLEKHKASKHYLKTFLNIWENKCTISHRATFVGRLYSTGEEDRALCLYNEHVKSIRSSTSTSDFSQINLYYNIACGHLNIEWAKNILDEMNHHYKIKPEKGMSPYVVWSSFAFGMGRDGFCKEGFELLEYCLSKSENPDDIDKLHKAIKKLERISKRSRSK